KQVYFRYPDGKLAGFSAAKLSTHPDKIAKFQKLYAFPLLSQVTLAQAPLHCAARIAGGHEYELPDIAHDHTTPPRRSLLAFDAFLETRPDIRRQFKAVHPAAVRINTEFF